MVSRSYLGRISRLTFIIESNYHRFNRFIVRFSTILFLSLFLDLSKYRLCYFLSFLEGKVKFHFTISNRRIYSYIYICIYLGLVENFGIVSKYRWKFIPGNDRAGACFSWRSRARGESK